MTEPADRAATGTGAPSATLDLKLLNEYAMWGDARLVRVLETLSDAEFDEHFGDLAGSIRGKTAHILSIYRFFVAIFEGRPYPRFPDLSARTRRELLAMWRELIHTWPGYLDRLGPDALLALPLADQRRVEARHCIADALLHTVHHRGQLLTMIRLLGKDLEAVPTDDVNLDYLKYLFSERPEFIHPAATAPVGGAG